MKKKINRLIPGLLAGILTPALTFQLYVLLQHPDKNMRGVLGMFAEMHVLTHVISLAVIPNLAVFFLFLRFHFDKAARGVLGATILYALLVLILRVS